MASAILASPNEPYFGDRKVYTRKHIAPNPNPNPNPNPSPSTNPILTSNQIQLHDPASNKRHLWQRDLPPPPFSPPPEMIKSSPPLMASRKGVSLNEAKEVVRGGYVTFNLGAYTRRELKELKRRLVSELEHVRSVKSRLETLNASTRPACRQPPPPPPPLNVHAATNPNKQPNRSTTPKSAQQTKNKKRPNPFSNEPDPNRKRLHAVDSVAEKVLWSMLKRCGQILTKLMKQKSSWVFNKPVDAVALRLFDYHQIIKKPMDLGTVKSNLEKGLLKSPGDFAADVRLTFENAMLYNPKDHDVHKWAMQLLAKFNQMFDPAHKKFELERARVCAELVETRPLLANQQPVREAVVEGMKVGKLPKPKAKDPIKREMSVGEKAKLEQDLGHELEEMAPDKMLQLVQIIKKRNPNLVEGDEIELDFETMDAETLWEVDRFVTNYKKMVSKIKRQELVRNKVEPPALINQCSPVNEVAEVMEVAAQKVGEEDVVVDIGEEIPVGKYPTVEIEKDDAVAADHTSGKSSSSSSGYSSDSSSSSGSDSGSSSGSGSDADTAQSPYVEESKVVDIMT